jgi:Spx/MgsR family transcriptional regulator
MIARMSDFITLYGIANCDTVKKARTWLVERGVEARFHDFKKDGVPPDHLRRWINAAGWERVLNRQGQTWRKLDAATQASACDAASAAALLTQYPSAIKRPVLEWSAAAGDITVGFVPDDWERRLR